MPNVSRGRGIASAITVYITVSIDNNTASCKRGNLIENRMFSVNDEILETQMVLAPRLRDTAIYI
jgi:hypothetical protein